MRSLRQRDADTAEADAIACEIRYGTDDVRDVQFRAFLHVMGFKQTRIANSAAQDFDVTAPAPTQTGEVEDEWAFS
jgi:hypothetical protein